jgi:nicotinamide-nucleotide amidase
LCALFGKPIGKEKVMSFALLAIGTELTRGDLHNTNSGWLAERLTSLGHEVTHMLSVDDEDGRIVGALAHLASHHEVIVCTGGLGPTTDDRTSACVAQLLGAPLVRDAAALEAILASFKARGRDMAPSNGKQADFPAGAVVLPNRMGTAPGFSVQIGSCTAYFLPGVPREMAVMFDEQVAPRLPPQTVPFTTLRLRSFGLPEAEVNDRLALVEGKHQVTLGYRASHAEIEVKVQAKAQAEETAAALEVRATRAADEVAELLGPFVYSRGRAQLPEVVGQLLLQQRASLGLAESCTGGLLSQWIASVPGASRYFKGGVVAYANSAKAQLLGVSETMLRKYGAVSEPVARAMAEGAQRAFGSDYSIALTGLAGPGGGTKEKPVGLVFWAVAGPQGTVCKRVEFFGDRPQIQSRSAMSALFTLYKLLTNQLSP